MTTPVCADTPWGDPPCRACWHSECSCGCAVCRTFVASDPTPCGCDACVVTRQQLKEMRAAEDRKHAPLRARLEAWQKLTPQVREICLAHNIPTERILSLATLAPASQLAAITFETKGAP